MATQRAADDPATLTFDATIEDIDGDAVVLDTTYFYAESGGQPSDRGEIDGQEVTSVDRTDNRTWHTVADTSAWSIGDVVTAEIDRTFRRHCMAAHTASHALFGAARVRFDTVGYGGFEITPSKVRIDLTTPDPIDDAAMLDLERLTNEVIWEDRSVTWSEWPAAEVRDNDDIALNVATEVVHTEDTVRIVEIEDWDLAACGGTHVSSTGDIGSVSIIDRSNPGEGMTRIEFVVGPERIAQQAIEKATAWDAKAQFGVPLEEVPDRIDRLERERHELESRIAAMEQSVIAAAVTGPDAIRFDRNGETWAIAAVPDVEASAAAGAADTLLGDAGDVIVITGGTGRAHLVVASGGPTPATEVIDAALDGFEGGGGGGSETKAQAGGIGAEAAEVVDRLVDIYAHD